jgi:DNA primase
VGRVEKIMFGKPSEEIKEKLDIIDVISEYIQLQPAGMNNFKARCPFHNEKTPSLFVSKDKQIFKCFGCSVGGDIFTFVMKMEGLEFVDALRILANKAGVELKREQPEFYSKRAKVLEILKLSAEYYHQALLKSKSGQIARDYIISRKLKPETVQQFKLGFSPDDWEMLSRFLRSRGFKDDEILASGLVVPRRSNQETENRKQNLGYYDRFRFRLMFPIWDGQNNVVGFTARQLREEKNMGKYINTPQSLAYDKSRVLYGLNFAKSEIRREDQVIIVEGNMDVIASHQANVTNVVASSGTALTSMQIDLIKRYTNNVVFSFDMDLAGNMATQRGIDLALESGLNIKVTMPEKDGKVKDPDDIIKTEGVKVWKDVINSAKSIMDYYFESNLSKLDLAKVEDKKAMAKFLLPKIKKISDKVEQAFYLQKLAGLISVGEDVLRDEMRILVERSEYKKPSAFAPTAVGASADNESETDLLQERLFGLIMSNFHNFKKLENFDLGLFNERITSLYKEIKAYYNNTKSFEFHSFCSELEKDSAGLTLFAKELVLGIEKEQSQRERGEIFVPNDEIDKCLKRLIEIDLKKKMVEIEAEMRNAEVAKDVKKVTELSTQFNILSQKLKY